MAHDQSRRLIQTVVVDRADELILDYLETILEQQKQMGTTLASILSTETAIGQLVSQALADWSKQHAELLTAIAAVAGEVDTTALQAIADAQAATLAALNEGIAANPDPAASVSGATSGTTPVPEPAPVSTS